MIDIQTVLIVAGALVVGVFCTLLIQWLAAVRKLTDQVTETGKQLGEAGKQISELAETLQPAARRIAMLSDMVGESEPDLRQVQGALHELSNSSARISDSVSRVSGWVAMAIPVLTAALERWGHDSSPHAQAAVDPRTGMASAQAVPGGPVDVDVAGAQGPVPAESVAAGASARVEPPVGYETVASPGGHA